MQTTKCPNCGAPISSEVCPFCGNILGIGSEDITPEYPVIGCRSAKLTFFTTVFPMIFVVSFGFFGFIFPIFFEGVEDGGMVKLICIPFAVISVVSAVIVLYSLSKYLLVKALGRDETGTVYGYVDDSLMINGAPAQKVKILVDTKQGKRFILYSTGSTDQKYAVNSKVDLRVYKKYFLVSDVNTEYF